MNNLNSNLGNKSNSNSNNTNTNSNSSNSSNNSNGFFEPLGNMSLVILIAAGIVVLVFVLIIISIYVKAHNQNKIRDHVEQEIVPYIHDSKNNPKVVYATKLPSSTLGNEYSLNFWIYINGLDYRQPFNKHIITKGKQDSYNVNEEYMQANPSIYLERKTNTMVFSFELEGGIEKNNDLGCFNVLNILENPYLSSIEINLKKLIKDFDKDKKLDNFKYIGTTSQTEEIERLHIYGEGTTKDFKLERERDGYNSTFRLKDTNDSYYDFTGTITFVNEQVQLTKKTIKEDTHSYTIEYLESDDKYIIKNSDKHELCIVISNGITINNIINSGLKLEFVERANFTNIEDVTINNEKIEKPETGIKIPLKFDFDFYDNSNTGSSSGFDTTKLLSDAKLQEIEELKKPLSIEKCREILKKTGAKYFGMFGDNSEYPDKNTCYSLIPKDDNSDVFHRISINSNKESMGKVINDKCKSMNESRYGFGSKNHMYIHNMDTGKSIEQIRVKNIPLQRWVCMNLQVHNNVVDIFMDGLLYKSHVIQQGSPKPNDDNIIIGNNGGFDGYLSRAIYSNKALHPGEIYQKYKQGPRISLTTTDRIKKFFGMGPKEPESRNDEGNNQNNY